MPMEQTQATQLWDQLRTSLLDAQATIKTIIETKAWEPLGYPTLTAAWAEKMADVNLAAVILTHVVYQMLDEGATNTEVTESVTGVGPTTVEALRRQQRNGVPPENATLRTKTSDRKGTSTSGTLFLHVGSEKLAAWTLVAARHETTPAEFALEALEAAFSEMA